MPAEFPKLSAFLRSPVATHKSRFAGHSRLRVHPPPSAACTHGIHALHARPHARTHARTHAHTHCTRTRLCSRSIQQQQMEPADSPGSSGMPTPLTPGATSAVDHGDPLVTPARNRSRPTPRTSNVPVLMDMVTSAVAKLQRMPVQATSDGGGGGSSKPDRTRPPQAAASGRMAGGGDGDSDGKEPGGTTWMITVIAGMFFGAVLLLVISAWQPSIDRYRDSVVVSLTELDAAALSADVLQATAAEGVAGAADLLQANVAVLVVFGAVLLGWAAVRTLSSSPLLGRRLKVYYNAFIIIGTLFYLKKTKRWRSTLSDAEENAVWDAAHERLAARALHMIQDLRGFWVKIGQYMSSRSDVTPKVWVKHLSKLQDSLPPVAAADVERRIEKEFGKTVEQLFDDWNPEPLATASIAQVHTARMKRTGQRVAVKVQHDGIDVLMRQDMVNTERIMSWVAYVDPDFNFKPVITEWAKVAMKELNFVNEAANQRTVSANLRKAGIDVIIPEIMQHDGADMVTNGAMVMEFCEGFKVTDQAELDAHGVDREALMNRICQAYANQVYVDGYFNADPHPGNILVQVRDGRAVPVLLDFGMTKVLDDKTRLSFAQLIYSTATMDFGGLLRSFDGMGLKLKRDDPMEDMQGMRFVLRDTQPPDESRETSKTFREARWKERQELPRSERNPVEAWPPDLLFFFRVTLLLKGMCCELGVRLKYMSVLAPYARLAMIQSVPLSTHCVDIVSPRSSKTLGKVEDDIQDLLAALYTEGKIVGCQVAVYKDGKKIVDSCAGTMGPCDPRPVKQDTVFNCFSVTKVVAAVALLQLVDRGLVNLSDLVSAHWPAFAANGKGRCTVEHILTHRAGLQRAGTDGGSSLKTVCSWDEMLAAMADATPVGSPGGSANAKYHIMSFGWLIGGIVQAATNGQHLRDLVQKRIAAPLGLESEFFLGLGVTGAADRSACPDERVATLSNGFFETVDGGMSPEELKELLQELGGSQQRDAEGPDAGMEDGEDGGGRGSGAVSAGENAQQGSVQADSSRTPETNALVESILARTSSTGSEWEKVGVKENVTIWKEQTEGSSISIRGRGTINAPFDVVMGLIKDTAKKKLWDEMFVSKNVIEQKSLNISIVQESFKGIWPVAGRDFCTLQTVQLLPNGGGGVIVGTSIEDDRCPEAPPSVRATCVLAGYVVRPVDGGASCVLDMLSHANLNASIPKFIMAKVAEKQPMNVFRLRKLAEGLSASAAAGFAASGKEGCDEVPAGAAVSAAEDRHAEMDTQPRPNSSGNRGDGGRSAAQGSAADPAANKTAASLSTLVSAGVTPGMKSSSLLMDPCMFNTEKIRRACIPSANGHFSARALARFYACLANKGSVDGVQLLRPELVAAMSQTRATMPGTRGMPSTEWGLGVRKYSDTAFGHGGLGGSIALCDPASGLSIAVTVNKLTLDRSASREIVNRVCELLKLDQFAGLNTDFGTT